MGNEISVHYPHIVSVTLSSDYIAFALSIVKYFGIDYIDYI